MLRIIGFLLLAWVAVMVVGAVLHGLFWLIVVGAVLFLGTAAYGAIKGKGTKQIH